MTLNERAERAAAEFMREKGYDVEPTRIEEEVAEGIDLWYFFYNLDEGVLELEVSFDGLSWSWETMDFVHHKRETLGASGR